MSIKDIYDLTPVSAFWGKPRRVNKRKRKKVNALRKSFGRRGKYEKYMASPAWRAFREKILDARGRQCESCGSFEGGRDIHHLTYIRLGCELPEDVLVLCRPCHEKRHRK